MAEYVCTLGFHACPTTMPPWAGSHGGTLKTSMICNTTTATVDMHPRDALTMVACNHRSCGSSFSTSEQRESSFLTAIKKANPTCPHAEVEGGPVVTDKKATKMIPRT